VITAVIVLVIAEEVGWHAWKGRHVVIDQTRVAARQSPAFRAHVADLHGWAAAAITRLEWRGFPRLTVEMDDLLAECFEIHYPDAAGAVREINQRVLHRQAIGKAFAETAERLASTVPGHAVPDCATFLRWVGESPIEVTDDAWHIGDGVAVLVRPPGSGMNYLIAEVQRTADTESTLEKAKIAAALMWKHKTSVALRTMADDAPTRTRALEALRDATVDQDPPNECPRCPSPLRSARGSGVQV
jgi:hypothetical protein